MRATRIMANLRVADVDAAKSFYRGYLTVVRWIKAGQR